MNGAFPIAVVLIIAIYFIVMVVMVMFRRWITAIEFLKDFYQRQESDGALP